MASLARCIVRKTASLLAGLAVALVAIACGSTQAPSPLPTLQLGPTARPLPTLATPAATPAPPVSTPTLSATTVPSTSSAPGAGASGGSAAPTPIDLTPYLTASIDLVNLADDAVDVDVGIASQDGSEVTSVAKYHLEPFDSVSEQVVASAYRITFTHTEPGLSGTTCDLNVEDGNQFEFAVAAQLVTIAKIGYEPTEGAELVAATSSLCKP